MGQFSPYCCSRCYRLADKRIAGVLYGVIKNMYSDYTASELIAELNRIKFLKEYIIAGKSYKRKEIYAAFGKLINEKKGSVK